MSSKLSEYFSILQKSVIGAVKFYIWIFIFVLPLNMFFTWYDRGDVSTYFTLKFVQGFILHPLNWFLIFMMTVVFFISLIVNKKKNAV